MTNDSLMQLVERCGAVLQVISQLERHGAATPWPHSNSKTNAVRLLEALSDLERAIRSAQPGIRTAALKEEPR